MRERIVRGGGPEETPLTGTRVLVIGASGQVGRALLRALPDADVVAASHRHARAGDLQIDLGDPAPLEAALRAVRPEVILLAGAMCNVDQCETDQEACERVNVQGPAVVARYAAGHGARVVLFSTDHVFDGAKDRYAEDDPVAPLNRYSASKVGAEQALRAALPHHHVVIRTSWVYGPDDQRRNFILRLLDRAGAGEPIAVPSDQWGSPTYTEDLAAATRFLLERGAAGTFHATGPELVDRATLALRVCDRFGLDRRLVTARLTAELGQRARRSLRVWLDCRRLAELGGPRFRTIAEGLDALVLAGMVTGAPR